MQKKYPDKRILVPRFEEANGFYTSKQRSKLMSKIKGKDTMPEQMLRKALWKMGYRYRKDYKRLAGKPDIVIIKYRVAIFVDGEFWHGYNWDEKKKKIKSNRKFWIPKIERNIQRDKENNEKLKQDGWKVVRFWAQYVKKDLAGCLKEIQSQIE